MIMSYLTVYVMAGMGYPVVLQSGICYCLRRILSGFCFVWDMLKSGLSYSLGFVQSGL